MCQLLMGGKSTAGDGKGTLGRTTEDEDRARGLAAAKARGREGS